MAVCFPLQTCQNENKSHKSTAAEEARICQHSEKAFLVITIRFHSYCVRSVRQVLIPLHNKALTKFHSAKNTVSPLHMNFQVASFQRCKHAPVCQLLYCTTVLFKVLYCKIKNILFFVFVCFLCIICVKSIINILQYSTI